MITKAPKTITKTTMNLLPGDEILIGNMYDGFDTKVIVDVTRSSINKRQALVTVKYNHGGSVMTVEGKNTRWSVVA